MPILTIIEYPDSRLRERSSPLEVFDAKTAQLARNLIDTMHSTQSIGLSAVQVGEHQRMLVMDHSSDQSAPEVYANPQLVSRRKTGLVEERCLSVPGVVAHVLRPTQVTVRAMDEKGRTFERELVGMSAVCLQHEMDHFDGKLLVDRINWFKRRRLRARLARAGRIAATA